MEHESEHFNCVKDLIPISFNLELEVVDYSSNVVGLLSYIQQLYCWGALQTIATWCGALNSSENLEH